MEKSCTYEDCEEKAGVLTSFGTCLMCGDTYCPRHLTKPEYARFLTTCLPTLHPGQGFCVDCVARHRSEHIKGAIDRKCSRIDCLANLGSMTTVKRMCSYCGRWFCTGHFFTRDQLTTELLSSLKKHKVIDGEGACEDCMKKDPVGAMIAGKKGFLGGKAAEMGEKLAAVIGAKLPRIAHETGESLVKGTVEGIREEKHEIVRVAQESLDAPVKQRIWGTIVALVGTVLVALVSMAMAKRAGEFFQTYRLIAGGVFGLLFLVTLVTSVARILAVRRVVKRAGALGREAQRTALAAFRRALWIHIPLLVLLLAVTAAAAWWFVRGR
ncbi:MAG: hypothetical protein HYY17_12540 [Planctomycetes bacterium]|nr:hypothetical protein [Planctomycetota bacterium]